MRIGFDGSLLAGATVNSGGGRYARSLLRALTEALDDGDEVVVFAPAGSRLPLDDAGRLVWSDLEPLPLSKLSAFGTHMLRLPRLVKQERLDVFHSPFVHTRPSLAPVPGNLDCPLVVTVHDLIPLTFYGKAGDPLPRKMRLFYQWNLRRALKAERIVTVSETARSELVEETGVDGSRVDVVLNGVTLPENVDSHQTLQRHRIEKPFLLYVGSMEPRKNLERLLRAYDLAARELPHDLVVVTEPSSGHRERFRDALAAMDHGARVRVLSHLSDWDLAGLYQSAELFVFPSLAEGFGLPPVEAMLSGTPVAASNVSAMPEVLGEAALYFDPLSVESMASVIVEAAADEVLRAKLAELGRSRAARYTWPAAAAQTLEVYRRAIGRRSLAVSR